jgi:CDP-paratose synthetase
LNILITGASGFLGSALVRRLSKTDYQVSLLVRKNTDLYRLSDLSSCQIGRCESGQEINQFISDVSPDAVIHAACCYGRDGESSSEIIDSNIRFGTLILDAMNGLEKKFSFINTCTVLPRNVSLYALTKLQFEELGEYEANHSNNKLQFINIKLQHMYGPGDHGSKFTSYVIDACKNNVPTLPLTLGEQKRDFIYIDDVVEAYIKVLENLPILEGVQQIEVGSGEAPRLRDFVETAHKLTGSKTELLFGQIPYRENDVMCMVANIDTLKKLGWIPKFDIASGIKKTIDMDVFR